MRFTPEDLAQARTNIKRALELRGLVDETGNPICPSCGRSGQGRVRLFPGGGYQCFSSEWCNRGNGKAIDLLVEDGWRFGDAVLALLGRPHGHTDVPAPKILSEVEGFKAVVDSDVYERLVALGDVDAAVAFYGRWHITEAAVKELGATMITDVPAMKATMLREFGVDRLAACGVVRPADDKRKEYWTVGNANYPVLEPHHGIDGRIVGLQARASEEREARYKQHVAYTQQKKEAEARGETFRPPASNERYVGKFSSLRGGQPGVHLVGAGLPRLRDLPTGSRVHIVEGVKDLLAMRSIGDGKHEAYALPGVGVAPPEEVIYLLARFDLRIAFDGDAGGDVGTQRLAEHLVRGGIVYSELGRQWAAEHAGVDPLAMARTELAARNLDDGDVDEAIRRIKKRRELGLRCTRKRPPADQDITDVLVASFRKDGCDCPTCSSN